MDNGLFIATLDFGTNYFNGSNYWLEIDVKTNNAGSYASLTPLQPIMPAPYSVFAENAGNLSGTISAGQLSGALSPAQLPATVVTNGANISGTFTGNGAGVTNVNLQTVNSGGAIVWVTNLTVFTTGGTYPVGTDPMSVAAFSGSG